MGQKVSPVGLRVGVNRDWNSRWYANDKEKALMSLILKLKDLKTELTSLFIHLDLVLLLVKMVKQLML